MTDFGAELNLLTHLIVMGVDIQKEEITYKKINERQVTPTFLDIFPNTEGESVPAYIENFKIWGFMEGFKIYSEKLKVLNEDEEGETAQPKSFGKIDDDNADIKTKTKIYSFVMTDQNYCKRYCTTLLFYERYYVRKDEAILKRDKESTLMIKSSLQEAYAKYPYTMNDHDLIYLPKSITLVSTIPCFDAQKQILRYLYENLLKKDSNQQQERSIRIPKEYVQQLETVINKKKTGPGNVQVDELWAQSFSYDRNVYLKGFKKNDDYIIKETHLREFYISAIFSLLDLSNGPVERIVTKLHNEEIEEELVRYRINKAMGVDLPPIGYKPLFKQLSARNIVKIFKAILLERQIIFFSAVPGEIPYITEAFLNLLSPMMWCCIYIPYMPLSVWEVLHAVMPFIVGIPSEHKEFITSSIDLKDKIVVDLDNDTVQGGEQDFPLPRKAEEFLISKMEELYRIIKSFGLKKGRAAWVEVTLKCRHYFNIFLLELINNIIPFFKHAQEETLEKESASEVFNCESYFKQFPDLESSTFAREMFKTMMFTNFIEESYISVNLCEYMKKSRWEDQVDEVSTFLNQINQLQNNLSPDIYVTITFLNILHPKAIAQIESDNNNSIEEATQRYFNPEKIDLLPYLVKYYQRFVIEAKGSAKTSQTRNPLSLTLAARGYSSPVGEAPLGKSYRETLSLNQSSQAFPPLNKARIVDLKQVFSDKSLFGRESISTRSSMKLHIFSEPKPIYQPRETQSEIIRLMDAHRESMNMPLAEPPINNPTNLLRKSNYFLYYQMVKRNEMISPDVRRVSEYEQSLYSPERKTLRSQTLRFSHFSRDIFNAVESSIAKVPNTTSSLLPMDQGFSARHGSLFSRKPMQPKDTSIIPEEKYMDDFSKLSEENEPRLFVQRSATDKAPEIKRIFGDDKRPWELEDRKDGFNRVLQSMESEGFVGSNRMDNLSALERQSDLESPVLKISNNNIWQKSTKSKAKSAKKQIFELKKPVKLEEEMLDNSGKRLLNRSISMNGSSDIIQGTGRIVQSVVPNSKVGVSKGDTDSSPQASPGKPRRKVLQKILPRPIKDLLESPVRIEDDSEDSTSWEKIGHGGDTDRVEYEPEEFKEDKMGRSGKKQNKENVGKGVLIKNLDTGEVIPIDEFETINVRQGKSNRKK